MEILAPVGNEEMLKAALLAGADAVFLGSTAFQARSQKVGFSLERLPTLCEEVHRQDAKIYLTLNTLIYEEEREEAFALARSAYLAGVDALLVQDLGLAEELRQQLPQIPLHASTQMALAYEADLQRAAALGIQRVVLPRELSLAEIRLQSERAHRLGMEVEVFVQGAQCVCYSGHCQLSQELGGRSANRGACAQPCRFSYRLHRRMKRVQSGEERASWLPIESREERSGQASRLDPFAQSVPLLSPKDICQLAELDSLKALGVDSLKIEGRMRSPDYVATSVRLYRKALGGDKIGQREQEELLLAFNRGGSFSSHRLRGERGRSFLSGTRVGSHGLLLGHLEQIRPKEGRCFLRCLPTRQGLTLEKGELLSLQTPEGEELASAPIAKPQAATGGYWLSGFHPKVLEGLLKRQNQLGKAGTSASKAKLEVYWMRSPRLLAALGKKRPARRAFDLELLEQGGDYLFRLLPSSETNLSWELALPKEEGTELSVQRLRQQLEKRGESVFYLRELCFDAHLETVALRVASLNHLRRTLLEALEADLLRPYQERRLEVVAEAMRHSATARSAETFKTPEDRGATSGSSWPEEILYLPAWRSRDASWLEGLLPFTHRRAFALPYLSLVQLEEQEGETRLQALFQSGALYAVLPAHAPLHLMQGYENRLYKWRGWGLQGLFASGPSFPQQAQSASVSPVTAPASPAPLPVFLLPDAHLANRWSFRYYLNQGVQGMALASELDIQGQLNLWKALWELHQQDQAQKRSKALDPSPFPLLILPVEAVESMLFLHCPVGFGETTCKACQKVVEYELEDPRGRRLPYLPLPEQSCSGRLYAPLDRQKRREDWQPLTAFCQQNNLAFTYLRTLLPRDYASLKEAGATKERPHSTQAEHKRGETAWIRFEN